jgi:hypothetical protein
MTALPTAQPAYGLKGPSAGRAVDNATPQGSTYLRGNSVQSNGSGSFITREDFLLWCKQAGMESPKFWCYGEAPTRSG